jgi:SAM-dependent methyltransferase
MNAAVVFDLETVHCPVCGPAPNRLWMNDGKPTRYLRCLNCGTIYASPRVARALRHAWLDRFYQPGSAALVNEASRRRALEQEGAILRRYLSGGRLLDVGCDLGAFFASFPDPAWQRFGVEVSPGAAQYAARTYGARVFPGTICQAGYPAAFFDLVTMIDMFSLVDDPRADLAEAARILKPGGLLALEVPGQAWTTVRNRGLLCWLVERRWTRLHTDSTYLYWYSARGLRTLFEETGFRPLAAHVIGSPESPHRWRNLLTQAHQRLMAAAVRRLPPLLSWAPKYLAVARREEQPA